MEENPSAKWARHEASERVRVFPLSSPGGEGRGEEAVFSRPTVRWQENPAPNGRGMKRADVLRRSHPSPRPSPRLRGRSLFPIWQPIANFGAAKARLRGRSLFSNTAVCCPLRRGEGPLRGEGGDSEQ